MFCFFYPHFGHVHLGRVGENKIESPYRYIFFIIIEIMTLSLKIQVEIQSFSFFIWAPLIITPGGQDSERYCCKGRTKQQKHSFKVTLQELSVQHHHSSAQMHPPVVYHTISTRCYHSVSISHPLLEFVLFLFANSMHCLVYDGYF